MHALSTLLFLTAEHDAQNPIRQPLRRMVPLLVNMLEIHSSNSLYQPVIQALELIKRYMDTSGIWYPAEEQEFVERLQDQMRAAPASFDCLSFLSHQALFKKALTAAIISSYRSRRML